MATLSFAVILTFSWVCLLTSASPLTLQWTQCPSNFLANSKASILGRENRILLSLAQLSLVQPAVRGWEFSLHLHSVLSHPLKSGSLRVSLFDSSSQRKDPVMTQILPLCGEWSETACALNWNGTLLYGMIPLYVEENEPLGDYTAVVEIFGQDGKGRTLEHCFSTTVHVSERIPAPCRSNCGDIMAYTPAGVPAKSNAQYQGTGESCGGRGTWGLQYQCVELVQREMQIRFGVWYAKQMCSTYPSDRFTKVTSPQSGDIFVRTTGTYGHTAIVRSNNGNGYVTVVEQNGSCSGVASYSFASNVCFLRRK